MVAKCAWLKDSNKTIKGEVSVECWEQWARPEYNTCRERNSVCCWNGSLTHSLIHLGVLQALLTHSNPFFLLLYPISYLCLLSRGKRRQSWYVHCLKWKDTHNAYTQPRVEVVHARKLLTCPSALAPPLGADEVLFLKGMPTFHPFVSGWKEKRRKSARKGWKMEMREAEEMPLSTRDVRLTMVRTQQSSSK